MKINLDNIAGEINARVISAPSCKTQGFSIDSRTILPDEVFIAIKGDKYDGHDFIEAAVKNGARAVVLQDPSKAGRLPQSIGVIQVKDTKEALKDIARLIRQRSSAAVIGITGSCGKTTTKDMAADVLSFSYRVLKNQGTLNNNYGLPLTLMRLNDEHELAVVEMGMNHAGEIRELNRIAGAEVGVITSVHPVHIEHLGSIEEIAACKWELIETLGGRRTAIINTDNEHLKKRAASYSGELVSFGINQPCHIRADDIREEAGKLVFRVEKEEFKLNMLGRFNVYNALAAISLGRLYGLKSESIRQALDNFSAPPGRMQIIKHNNIILIHDAYNANPASMKEAIKAASDFWKQSSNNKSAKKTKKGARGESARLMLVLADMLELGAGSEDYHRQVGSFAAGSGASYLLTLGDESKALAEGAREQGMNSERIFRFDGHEALARRLDNIAGTGDIILFKGSRKMQVERAMECFMNYSTR